MAQTNKFMPAPENNFYACPCWQEDSARASVLVDEVVERAIEVADTLVIQPICVNLRILVYARALAKSVYPVTKADRQRVEEQVINVLRAEFDKVRTID